MQESNLQDMTTTMAITTTTLDLVSQIPTTTPPTSHEAAAMKLNNKEETLDNEQENEQLKWIREKESLLVQYHDSLELLEDVKLQLKITKDSLLISGNNNPILFFDLILNLNPNRNLILKLLLQRHLLT